jgi:hypothetical protein
MLFHLLVMCICGSATVSRAQLKSSLGFVGERIKKRSRGSKQGADSGWAAAAGARRIFRQAPASVQS